MEVMASFDGGPWRYALYGEEIEEGSSYTEAGRVWYRVAAVLALSGSGRPPLFRAGAFTFVTPDGDEVECVTRDRSVVSRPDRWELEVEGRIEKVTPLERIATEEATG